jgi:hypothetical protein
MFITTEQKVLGMAEKYLAKRFDVIDKFLELENPVNVIEKIVENIKTNHG